MERYLPNKSEGPPGGWRYRVPETGQYFDAISPSQLYQRIRAHYTANGFNVPPNIEELVEDYICQQPETKDYCREPIEKRVISARKLARVGFQLALHGTQRLLGRESLVSQAQATARAKVCTTCPENVPLEDCAGCQLKHLQDVVETVRGRARTPSDEQLQTCRVCLCNLKAKIWLPLPRLLKMMTEGEKASLPDFCWLHWKE